MSDSNVILYRTEEATCKSDLQVRAEGNRRVQRSSRLDLLDRSPAVGHRVRNTVAKGDAATEATVKDNLTVRTEGRRPVSRTITVNEWLLLNGNGRISYDAMKRIAHDHHDEFDRQRMQHDGIAADAVDMEAIEAEVLKTRKGGRR